MGEYTIEFLDENKFDEYDEFIDNHVNGNYNQYSKWREVKNNWGSEIIVVRDSSGKIRGGALVLIKKIPIIKLSMLYVPRGPVYDYSDEEVAAKLLEGIKKIARRNFAFMLRIDPILEENDAKAIALLEKLGLKLCENENEDLLRVRMRCNYILELNGRTEDEIFAGFHSKWRYNIRLAQRKGVSCQVRGPEALPEFFRLMQVTGTRDGFNIRGEDYFKRFMDALGERCRLYMCYYDGVAVSGALSVQYGGKTVYVYGASSNEYRNVMPNYLMQWEMIRWAIESKCNIYDFVGIPHYDDENHPEYGMYRFKKGFGGRIAIYAGAFDKLYLPVIGKLLEKYIDRM